MPFFLHSGPAGSVAFSPDGHVLATCGGFTVRLWDMATRRQLGDSLGRFVESRVGGDVQSGRPPPGHRQR